VSRPILLLVDGHSLAYRAYHALPPTLRTSEGELTNAVYGFVSMLLHTLQEQKPTHAAVAFDVGKTFRNDLFAAYKAQRAKTPPELHTQVERIKEVVEALGIPIFTLPGFEADDVLGTLARRGEEAGADVFIVTGDSDAFQLVDAHVRVITSGRRFGDVKIYDEQRLRERYGLAPRQLIDHKALVGDKSDNIPGVPGVGAKTATALLQAYTDLDGIYAHLDEIKREKLRRALLEHKEDVYLGRRLITIRTDLDIPFDLEACRWGQYDLPRLHRLFRELEFRTLLKLLPGEPTARQSELPLLTETAVAPALAAPSDFQLVQDDSALHKLTAALSDAERIAFDVESSSTDKQRAKLVGISLAWGAAVADSAYIPVGHDGARQLSLAEVQAALQPFLAGAKLKVAHNAKFDMTLLERHGFTVTAPLADTMIAAWLIDPASRGLGLKTLAFNRLGVEMTEISDLIGKGKRQISMGAVPLAKAAPYAAADAQMTWRLYDALLPELEKRALTHLFWDIEMPLVPVLVDMERTGILVDPSVLAELSRRLSSRLHELEQEIWGMVGYRFNVNSTQQLSEALFGKLNISAQGLRKTKSGHVSTSAQVLEMLQGKHPVVDLILEYRQLHKLLSTYVNALPELINPATGRIHTSYSQTAAETGRLASNNPNLQNIPVRTELGRQVRKAFVAAPGRQFLAADYSQVELRVLAHISGDPAMLAAFARGEDIHAHTASLVFGVPGDQVTKEQRRVAKMTNFAISYGVTDYGLAQRTGLTTAEAGRFIKAYFSTYPKVLEYIEKTKEFARRHGYVETLLGRRRYFPELQNSARISHNIVAAAERAAINHPIQGTAADIIKIAMINLHRRLEESGYAGKMLLQVHDELLLEVPESEIATTAELLRQTMESAYELKAALKVDVEIGPNWYDLAPYRP